MDYKLRQCDLVIVISTLFRNRLTLITRSIQYANLMDPRKFFTRKIKNLLKPLGYYSCATINYNIIYNEKPVHLLLIFFYTIFS